MLKNFSTAALALLMTGSLALAGQPGADWMSKADLKKSMEGQGYSSIVVGADDGHWEGEAVKEGKIVEFHADGKTGKITKSEAKTEH